MGKFVFNDKNYSGEPNPINDSIISANTTWSSDKINTELATIPSDLSDLSDVDLTNLQNGMTLKYNSGTLKFEAGVLYIEILQADYDQLTYDQKHNGIPYFITDGHGAASLPSYVDLTDILLAGNTTLTIQSPYITTAGTYDIYTDPEVPYISKVITTGQIVITFDEQSSDLAVKVRIT